MVSSLGDFQAFSFTLVFKFFPKSLIVILYQAKGIGLVGRVWQLITFNDPPHWIAWPFVQIYLLAGILLQRTGCGEMNCMER